MAHVIPALPHQPPLSEAAAPRSPIRAGDTTATGKGRWLHLAREINLLIATGRAQSFFSQWWADGQFSVAGAKTLRLSIPVPSISPAHTAVVVQVYGETPDTGTVYAVGTLGAPAEVSEALPGAAGWVALDVDVFDAVGDEVLELRFEDTCEVYGVCGWLVDLTTGLYPDADDELPAGPVGDATPIDDDEVADDEALDAGLVQGIRETQDAIRLRPHVVAAVAGIQGTVHRWCCTYPVRVPVMLVPTRSGRYRVQVRALMQGADSLDDFDLLIDRGDGGLQALFDAARGAEHPSITRLPVTAGAVAAWYEVEITLRPILPTPPPYAGIAWLGLYTNGAFQGDADKVIKAVSVIHIPEA